jgi:hypothetical protein
VARSWVGDAAVLCYRWVTAEVASLFALVPEILELNRSRCIGPMELSELYYCRTSVTILTTYDVGIGHTSLFM